MEQRTVQPKADQPRVTTEDLKQLDRMPSLTYRQTGIKTAPNRMTRSYARK